MVLNPNPSKELQQTDKTDQSIFLKSYYDRSKMTGKGSKLNTMEK